MEKFLSLPEEKQKRLLAFLKNAQKETAPEVAEELRTLISLGTLEQAPLRMTMTSTLE